MLIHWKLICSSGKAQGGPSWRKIAGELLPVAISRVWGTTLSWHQPHSWWKGGHPASGHCCAGHQVWRHQQKSLFLALTLTAAVLKRNIAAEFIFKNKLDVPGSSKLNHFSQVTIFRLYRIVLLLTLTFTPH